MTVIKEAKSVVAARLTKACVWYAVPIAIFFVAEIVNALVLKRHMAFPLCALYQTLDPVFLKTDFLRSMLLLHGQPPLLNVIAGIVLKAATVLGCAPETIASVVFGASGLATALLIFHMAARWTQSRVLATVAVVLYFINPSYYGGSSAGVGRDFFFYEFPLQPVLLFTCLSGSLWLERAELRAGLAFVLSVAVVVNTRTLFHPLLWAAVTTVAVLAPHVRKHARGTIALGVLALVLCSAWAIKNYVLFGVLTTSTWDGLNLDRGFTGLPAPLSSFDTTGPWPDATSLLSRFPQIASWPRESLRVVTAGTKPCGGTNWNNLYMVTTRNEAVARAMSARKDLGHYLGHIVLMYLLTTRPMYVHPYDGKAFGMVPDQFVGYLRLYERLFFSSSLETADPPSAPHWNVLNLLFLPALISGALFMISRSRGNRLMLALVVYTAFFPFISACLSDGFEGNRMRHSTYPLMIVLTLVTVRYWYRALAVTSKRI